MDDVKTDNKAAIVYVVQDNPQHAFWPAEKFGTIRQCLPTSGDHKPAASRMIPRLREALLGFDADRDFLLLSGGPLAVGAAFAILHERFDQFNILRWSTIEQDYHVVPVDLMLAHTNGDKT